MVARLTSGDVFGGYRIQAVAGRGGMGIVYRATELALDRPVALKLIAPGLADDAGFRQRFVRECKLAAALDHPNILPVYQAGEHDGVLYLVSRFVDGDDLLRVIRRDHLLQPRRAARIVAQVGAALDAAHARGLVHRDVKPANVLLTPDDHAYLADFGLSKRLHSVEPGTRAGAWVGTLDYVAPEQIRGESLDAQADVYALGCVLFHVLTGKVPFDLEGDEAKLWAHLHDAPPAPSELVPGVPVEFDAVVGRAMAKSPHDRYRSAGGVGRASLVATGHDVDEDDRTVAIGTGHSEATTVERTRRPARRALRPLHALPVLGAVAVAAVAVVLVLSGGGSGSSSPQMTTNKPVPSPPIPAAKPHHPVVIPIRHVGFRPNSMTLAGGDLWVVGFHRPTLTRIDGRTNRVVGTPGGVPDGATVARAGYGVVWVANSRQRSLTAIDPRTGKVRGSPTPIYAGQPVGLAVGKGAVWVIAYGPTGDSVVRVDPRTRRVMAVIGGFRRRELGKNTAVGSGGVWVIEDHRQAAALIDPRVDKVTRVVPVGLGPKGIAVGEGYVWVANSGDGTVSQIAEHATSERAPRFSVTVGHEPYDVAAGRSGVWVANFGDHTIGRIDPRTSTMVGTPIHVGRNPAALVLRGRTLWVASVGDNRIDRVDL